MQSLSINELRRQVMDAILSSPSREVTNAILQPLLDNVDSDVLYQAIETAQLFAVPFSSTPPRPWQDKMPTVLLGLVFDFLLPVEMMTIVERICKRFRLASRRGLGWSSSIYLDLPPRSQFWERVAKSGRLRHVKEVFSFGLDEPTPLHELLRHLPNLTSLDVDMQISAADCCAIISRAHTLSSLSIGGFRDDIPEPFLSHLRQLEGCSLRSIPVNQCRRLLMELESLPKLQHLHLCYMSIASFMHDGLCRLVNLTSLDLFQFWTNANASSSDSDLSALAALHKLERLRIYGHTIESCTLTPHGLGKGLTASKCLQSLDLSNTTLDPDTLMHVSSSLVDLTLYHIKMHPVVTLQPLRKLCHLRKLRIHETFVDWTSLPFLPAIREVCCSAASCGQTIDLSAIAGLPNLESLELYSPTTHFAHLTRCSTLQQLTVQEYHDPVLSPSDWMQVPKLSIHSLAIRVRQEQEGAMRAILQTSLIHTDARLLVTVNGVACSKPRNSLE